MASNSEMDVGLTYDLRDDYPPDPGAPADEYAEFDPLEIIEAVERALASLGYRPRRIGHIHQLVRFLAAGESVYIVLNIAEWLGGRSREAQVPALLEAARIPYTFSDPLTLALCLDKPLTKHVWLAQGLPTPPFAVIGSAAEIEAALAVLPTFPLFVKPAYEGTSKGISNESRVTSRAALVERVNWVLHQYHEPALVEPYLPGQEFTVAILGNGEAAEALGAQEIRLRDPDEVYGFEQKEHCEVRVEYQPVVDSDRSRQLCDLGLRAYHAVGCRDAGRVDIRLDQNGDPQLLEINPLPGLDPDYSSLPMIARYRGLSFEQLIAKIMQHALERQAVRLWAAAR